MRGIKVSSDGWVETLLKGPRLPNVNANGYRVLKLNGKLVKVHALIAEAFLEPKPSYAHTIDHINHDRGDNRAVNLRWATKVEQIKNQRPCDLSTHCGNNPLEYKRIGDAEWTWCQSQSECARVLGLNSGAINCCINGKRSKHGGYEFRRAAVEKIDGEVWREYYTCEVSNMGRIRHKTAPPFNPKISKGMEYAFFAGEMVHVIVAWAFLGEPPFEGATIDHINRDKSDNRVENLQWASMKEQRANQERVSICTHSKRVKTFMNGRWFVFESAMEAEAELNICAQNIGKCALGKRAREGLSGSMHDLRPNHYDASHRRPSLVQTSCNPRSPSRLGPPNRRPCSSRTQTTRMRMAGSGRAPSKSRSSGCTPQSLRSRRGHTKTRRRCRLRGWQPDRRAPRWL